LGPKGTILWGKWTPALGKRGHKVVQGGRANWNVVEGKGGGKKSANKKRERSTKPQTVRGKKGGVKCEGGEKRGGWNFNQGGKVLGGKGWKGGGRFWGVFSVGTLLNGYRQPRRGSSRSMKGVCVGGGEKKIQNREKEKSCGSST